MLIFRERITLSTVAVSHHVAVFLSFDAVNFVSKNAYVGEDKE